MRRSYSEMRRDASARLWLVCIHPEDRTERGEADSGSDRLSYPRLDLEVASVSPRRIDARHNESTGKYKVEARCFTSLDL